jgi:ABC-type multidrug transport system fused ATPase/permease subunit
LYRQGIAQVKTLRKLRLIFDRATKVRLLILMLAIIAAGLLDMLALGLIAPIVQLVLDPQSLYNRGFVYSVFNFLGFESSRVFLATLAFTLVGVYVFRAVYLLLFNRLKFRFIARRQALMSERLLVKIMGFSYLYHTHKNVAETSRIVNGDVNQLFTVITQMMLMTTDLFRAAFILLFLMMVSPVMTLMMMALALICVFIYFVAFRRKITNAGKRMRTTSIGMSKSVLQAFGGIKEIKLMQRESHFHKEFKANSDAFVKENTRFNILNEMPRMTIEMVVFGGAFSMVGLFLLSGANLTEMAPQLGMFVFAAFQLLPAVIRQVMYFNVILVNRPAVDAVYKSLYEENDIGVKAPVQADTISQIEKNIIVQGVGFTYPNVDAKKKKNVSFDVPHNKSVAFIGPSGAGKTTLADLILGVLTPDTGAVYYQGKSVHVYFDEWSKNIGYIPQQIYLLDESILANVAFGIDHEKIDEEKVWRALEQAQLAEFVRTLPDGVKTIVGDRGVRLSGGQRQRVGIARALYEDPSVLVLDEATSSLDNETEKAVMDAVRGLQGEKTMIIVAHRLSTIEHCDIVYKVENQTVTRQR